MTEDLDSQTVAQYLTTHPEFFDSHPELLTTIRLTSPVIGKAVSLHARQIEILREKHRVIEQQLAKMVYSAQNNQKLMERVFRWACLLLENQHAADLPKTVVETLKSTFNIPEATIRLWHVADEHDNKWFAIASDNEALPDASALAKPFSGRLTDNLEAGKWLENHSTLKSVALVPVWKTDQANPFGLIVLGSPDATRYQDSMATDLLAEIGKLAGTFLEKMTNPI